MTICRRLIYSPYSQSISPHLLTCLGSTLLFGSLTEVASITLCRNCSRTPSDATSTSTDSASHFLTYFSILLVVLRFLACCSPFTSLTFHFCTFALLTGVLLVPLMIWCFACSCPNLVARLCTTSSLPLLLLISTFYLTLSTLRMLLFAAQFASSRSSPLSPLIFPSLIRYLYTGSFSFFFPSPIGRYKRCNPS